MLEYFRMFLRDERGTQTLEYVVIAGLVAVAALLLYDSQWAHSLRAMLIKAVSLPD